MLNSKKMTELPMPAKALAENCARLALDKKAENVVILDLRGKSSVADYFVIATGSSERQVASIAEHVALGMKEVGEKAVGEEGAREGRWAVVDFSDVVVHVFQDHLRDYYDIERLFVGVPRIRLGELATAKM